MTKILMTMPDHFLSKIDSFALSEKMTRSELIRVALKSYIQKKTTPNSRFASEDAAKLEELIG